MQVCFLPLRSSTLPSASLCNSLLRVGGARRAECAGVQITFCTWLTASFISHDFNNNWTGTRTLTSSLPIQDEDFSTFWIYNNFIDLSFSPIFFNRKCDDRGANERARAQLSLLRKKMSGIQDQERWNTV